MDAEHFLKHISKEDAPPFALLCRAAIHPKYHGAIQEYLQASGPGADPSSQLFQAVEGGNKIEVDLLRAKCPVIFS